MRVGKIGFLCATLAWLATCCGVGVAEEAAPCADAVTNLAMRECLGKAYERADTELNAVWTKVMANVADADYLTAAQRADWKKELLEAQRAWVQFKEHDCNGAVGFEWWGGSGAGTAIASCLFDYTAARTKDLKQRYLDR